MFYYFTLSFSFEFTNTEWISFAHAIPYTYSDLKEYLSEISEKEEN